MWIRALEKHPNQKSYMQFEKLVNLSTASAILISSDGFKKWHVRVQFNYGAVTIAIFETEQEAKDAVDTIAAKLQAASTLEEL